VVLWAFLAKAQVALEALSFTGVAQAAAQVRRAELPLAVVVVAVVAVTASLAVEHIGRINATEALGTAVASELFGLVDLAVRHHSRQLT
jgi:hypothetical protein